MKLTELAPFIPDGAQPEAAVARTTHIGIGAHPDDLEILAIHGIGQCYADESKWFCGVTITDGSGFDRSKEWAAIRTREQREAAKLGRYGAHFQFDCNGSDITGTTPPRFDEIVEKLVAIFTHAQPKLVYTHNLFDSHDTHGGVARAVITALRKLSEKKRPEAVYGMEVWRNLDWLPEKMKTALEILPYLELQRNLIGCHKSQLEGNENYTEASVGRAIANATYGDPCGLIKPQAFLYALDMMPLIGDEKLTVQAFVEQAIDVFTDQLRRDVYRYEFLGKKAKR